MTVNMADNPIVRNLQEQMYDTQSQLVGINRQLNQFQRFIRRSSLHSACNRKKLYQVFTIDYFDEVFLDILDSLPMEVCSIILKYVMKSYFKVDDLADSIGVNDQFDQVVSLILQELKFGVTLHRDGYFIYVKMSSNLGDTDIVPTSLHKFIVRKKLGVKLYIWSGKASQTNYKIFSHLIYNSIKLYAKESFFNGIATVSSIYYEKLTHLTVDVNNPFEKASLSKMINLESLTLINPVSDLLHLDNLELPETLHLLILTTKKSVTFSSINRDFVRVIKALHSLYPDLNIEMNLKGQDFIKHLEPGMLVYPKGRWIKELRPISSFVKSIDIILEPDERDFSWITYFSCLKTLSISLPKNSTFDNGLYSSSIKQNSPNLTFELTHNTLSTLSIAGSWKGATFDLSSIHNLQKIALNDLSGIKGSICVVGIPDCVSDMTIIKSSALGCVILPSLLNKLKVTVPIPLFPNFKNLVHLAKLEIETTEVSSRSSINTELVKQFPLNLVDFSIVHDYFSKPFISWTKRIFGPYDSDCICFDISVGRHDSLTSSVVIPINSYSTDEIQQMISKILISNYEFENRFSILHGIETKLSPVFVDIGFNTTRIDLTNFKFGDIKSLNLAIYSKYDVNIILDSVPFSLRCFSIKNLSKKRHKINLFICDEIASVFRYELLHSITSIKKIYFWEVFWYANGWTIGDVVCCLIPIILFAFYSRWSSGKSKENS